MAAIPRGPSRRGGRLQGQGRNLGLHRPISFLDGMAVPLGTTEDRNHFGQMALKTGTLWRSSSGTTEDRNIWVEKRNLPTSTVVVALGGDRRSQRLQPVNQHQRPARWWSPSGATGDCNTSVEGFGWAWCSCGGRPAGRLRIASRRSSASSTSTTRVAVALRGDRGSQLRLRGRNPGHSAGGGRLPRRPRIGTPSRSPTTRHRRTVAVVLRSDRGLQYRFQVLVGGSQSRGGCPSGWPRIATPSPGPDRPPPPSWRSSSGGDRGSQLNRSDVRA